MLAGSVIEQRKEKLFENSVSTLEQDVLAANVIPAFQAVQTRLCNRPCQAALFPGLWQFAQLFRHLILTRTVLLICGIQGVCKERAKKDYLTGSLFYHLLFRFRLD